MELDHHLLSDVSKSRNSVSVCQGVGEGGRGGLGRLMNNDNLLRPTDEMSGGR